MSSTEGPDFIDVPVGDEWWNYPSDGSSLTNASTPTARSSTADEKCITGATTPDSGPVQPPAPRTYRSNIPPYMFMQNVTAHLDSLYQVGVLTSAPNSPTLMRAVFEARQQLEGRLEEMQRSDVASGEGASTEPQFDFPTHSASDTPVSDSDHPFHRDTLGTQPCGRDDVQGRLNAVSARLEVSHEDNAASQDSPD